MTEALFLAYEVVQGLILLRKGKLEIESGNHDFTKDVPCREETHRETRRLDVLGTLHSYCSSWNTYRTGKHPIYWGSFPDTLRKKSSPIPFEFLKCSGKIVRQCDITHNVHQGAIGCCWYHLL